MRIPSLAFLGTAVLWLSGLAVAQNQTQTMEFQIVVRNVSAPDTFYAVNPSPLGQGVWILHTFRDPVFTVGRQARNNGLEQLAEDGDASGLVASLSRQIGVQQIGVFPISPLRPDEVTRVRINAFPGQRLSLAVMLLESNDKFYATPSEGIALFTSNGLQLKGDVTPSLMLYDTGTEIDEEPGGGINQALRQRNPGQGIAQHAPIRQVKEGPLVDRDGYRYPIIAEQIEITLE